MENSQQQVVFMAYKLLLSQPICPEHLLIILANFPGLIITFIVIVQEIIVYEIIRISFLLMSAAYTCLIKLYVL